MTEPERLYDPVAAALAPPPPTHACRSCGKTYSSRFAAEDCCDPVWDRDPPR